MFLKAARHAELDPMVYLQMLCAVNKVILNIIFSSISCINSLMNNEPVGLKEKMMKISQMAFIEKDKLVKLSINTYQ